MKKYYNKLLPVILLSTFAGSASGSSTTGTASLTVTANVLATCTVQPATLNFNAYSLVQLDATTNISVTCTNGTPYNITLSAGSSGSITARTMVNSAGDPLTYQIYKDSARLNVWGTAAADLLASTGTGAAQPHTIYGRIFGAQTATAGSYSDTVTITVTPSTPNP